MNESRKAPPYYEMLGVQQDATAEAIRKAFHKIMLTEHPDKCTDIKAKALATVKTQAFNQAYETLSDPDKRKIYDLSFSTAENFEAKNTQNPDFENRRQWTTSSTNFFNNTNTSARFDLYEFAITIGNLKQSGDIEALKEYFEKNLADFKAKASSGYNIIQYLLPHLDESTYFLISQLDTMWLSKWDSLRNPDGIARALSALSIEHWDFYIGHVFGGVKGFKYNLNYYKIIAVIDDLFGCDASEVNERSKKFFSYLGLDWLREVFQSPNALGEALFSLGHKLRISALLNFLDGQDQWLEKTFNNEENIGFLLARSGQCMERVSFDSAKIIEHVAQPWIPLFPYLHTDWRIKLVANDNAFNQLLLKLSRTNYTFNKKINVEVFLAFIATLESIGLPEESSDTAFKKSYDYIQSMNEKHLYNVITNDRPFNEVLTALNEHQDEPFFMLRLFATIRAYQFELKKQPPALLLSPHDYSPGEKLRALMYLMDTMLNDRELQKNIIPALESQELQMLCNFYMSYLKPEKCHTSPTTL